MGTPVPIRAREEAARGAGPMLVTTIDRLDPATREELVRKYGLKVGKEAQDGMGEPTKVAETQVEELTREKYLQLKEEGLPDKEIAKRFGFKHAVEFTKWKKAVGVEGVRVPTISPRSVQNTVPPQQPVKDVKPEQIGQQKEAATTPLPSVRCAMVTLLQSGKTAVHNKTDLLRLLEALEALGIPWVAAGDGNAYTVRVESGAA